MSAKKSSDLSDWNAQARHLMAAQRLPQLQALMHKVLAEQPQNHEARQLLGVASSMQGQHAEGVAQLSLAIALSDFQPDWMFNLGNVLRSAGQTELAMAAYRKLLALAPGHAHAWFNLANLLAEKNQDGQAVDAYRRAMMADPSYLKAMVNLASSLTRVGQFDEALKVYRQILASDPGHAGALNNMANLLRDLGQPQEALRILQDLERKDPNSARVQNNLASAWREAGDLPRALLAYRRANELKADYPEGQMNYAMALLADGQWEKGWKLYEARLDPRLKLPVQAPPHAPWQGQDLRGKRILVHGEQGLGDMLQFCRFVPLLEQRGASVFLLTDRHLKRLFQTLDFSGSVLCEGDPVPAGLDYQVSLMSLPLQLGIFSPEQFLPTPYLRSQPQEVARWRQQLDAWFPRRRLRVGLVWAGNPRREMPQASLVDLRRSLQAQQVRELLGRHPDVDWVSLQKGEQESALPEVRSAAAQLKDFADTAALCHALDAVLTVDTSVAHVAAAVGCRTLMLSRFDACWRWGPQGRLTPWYDSLRIIRQHRYGDWSEALLEASTLVDKLVLG